MPTGVYDHKHNPHTKEGDRKISKVLQGHLVSDQTKDKIRKSMKGKTYEEIYGKDRAKEMKRKQSEVQKIAQNKLGVAKKKSDTHKKNKKNVGKIHPEARERFTKDNPMKRPEIVEKFKGEGNPNWKGGVEGYYHEKARQMFGSPVCQKCGISLEEYRSTHKVKKQFEMHCLSNNWTILEQWNWQCVCVKCHSKIHYDEFKMYMKSRKIAER